MFIAVAYGQFYNPNAHFLSKAQEMPYYGYMGRIQAMCMRSPYAPYCAKVFGDSEDLYKYAPYFGMGMGGYGGGYGSSDGGWGGYSGGGGGGYGGGFGMPRSADQCRAFMQRNGFRYQRGVATDSDSGGFKQMANMFQMCQRMTYRQNGGR